MQNFNFLTLKLRDEIELRDGMQLLYTSWEKFTVVKILASPFTSFAENQLSGYQEKSIVRILVYSNDYLESSWLYSHIIWLGI